MPDSQNREAKSTASEDPVSEKERELAQEALANFNRGDYAGCSAILDKLGALRPQDLKVTHNKIISDFFRSCDPHRTDVILKSLKAIDTQPPAPKQNSPGQQNSSGQQNLERGMIRYNQAIVLLHLKKYQAALKIINSIFSLQESLGMVCLMNSLFVFY